MNVSELCSRDAVCAPTSATLLEVAKLMCEGHVGAVVITKAPLDEPVPAGIITDRDIVRVLFERPADCALLRAGDVMTRDPLVINEDSPIDVAIQRLRARGVRRAPVVTAHGVLIGLVATDDLLAQVSGELANLASLLERQPKRERG